jgi:hypothetical protein
VELCRKRHPMTLSEAPAESAAMLMSAALPLEWSRSRPRKVSGWVRPAPILKVTLALEPVAFQVRIVPSLRISATFLFRKTFSVTLPRSSMMSLAAAAVMAALMVVWSQPEAQTVRTVAAAVGEATTALIRLKKRMFQRCKAWAIVDELKLVK